MLVLATAKTYTPSQLEPTTCAAPRLFQGHSLEHNNEINKTLGKVWKQATKQEKKIYEEKATADKLRYLHVSCMNFLCSSSYASVRPDTSTRDASLFAFSPFLGTLV